MGCELGRAGGHRVSPREQSVIMLLQSAMHQLMWSIQCRMLQYSVFNIYFEPVVHQMQPAHLCDQPS